MFLIGLRSCLNCGSFAVKLGMLCNYCENQLLEADFCQMELSHVKEMKVYSLFDWAPQQSDMLSQLLLHLKGCRSQRAWAYWAKIFWLRRVLELEKSRRLVLIPAASSTGSADHALHFAQALAKWSGAEVLNILEKLTNAQQKEKSREQRQGLHVQTCVKIAAKDPTKVYILVDDVLTTGATALASYKALGKPVNFEVWVLATRSLSCGVSMDLL